MRQLLDRLKERIKDPLRAIEGAGVIAPHIYPPAMLSAIEAEEQELGFSLPPLLRQVYLEVGNGGYGPGYGLVGVAGGTLSRQKTAAGLYHLYHHSREHDPAWQWPEKLVPICELGCGMYACIDCSDDRGRIIWFEPNPREEGDPLDVFLIPLSGSLEEWLTAWLDDRDLTEQAYENSRLKQWRDNGYGA